jgi:predicted nucleotidyltransferase
MAKRATLNEVTKTVKNYLRLLKKEGVGVERGILFGSFAKGSAKDDSDIDLCVVAPEFGKDPVAETSRLKFYTWDIDPCIEVVSYSPADLAVEEDPLAYEITKYGKEIKI